MKTIFLTLFAVCLGWFAEPSGLVISDEKVTCIINRNTSWEELQEYKARLWEKKQIKFDIEQVDFNRAKQITKIKIRVDCNDGFKGSAQTVFKDDKSKMSFYRIYDKAAGSPFGIGGLPEDK
jgi:hypothetical protein